MATGFRPAPPPSDRAVEVVHREGPGYRWQCAGCGHLVVGDPARTDGRFWFCC